MPRALSIFDRTWSGIRSPPFFGRRLTWNALTLSCVFGCIAAGLLTAPGLFLCVGDFTEFGLPGFVFRCIAFCAAILACKTLIPPGM
jgi:hypothetical protein